MSEKKRKIYVSARDAAKLKPGPCVVWEITGACRNGKCTCAHENRDELDAKNRQNGRGNYVQCTLPARCRYVLKQIRDGAWSFMKGEVREEAPCLVELLQWLPAQPDGMIDVDMVHSFIAANKIVAKKAAEEHSPEAVAKWEELCAYRNSLLTENAELEQQIRDEERRLREVDAQIKAAKEAAEAARRVAVKKRVAALLKSGADSASVDNKVATEAPVAPAENSYAAALMSGDVKPASVDEGATEAPVAPAENSYVAAAMRGLKPASVDEGATEAPVASAEERKRKEYQRLEALTPKERENYVCALLTEVSVYAEERGWARIVDKDD